MFPLLARPLQPSGYTWTIASRISDALNEAEQRFGPRDRNYFYAGHEFVSRHPGTWYPGNRQHIVIQLGIECTQDMVQAIYQLAHEVIHLLSPSVHRRPTILRRAWRPGFPRITADAPRARLSERKFLHIKRHRTLFDKFWSSIQTAFGRCESQSPAFRGYQLLSSGFTVPVSLKNRQLFSRLGLFVADSHDAI